MRKYNEQEAELQEWKAKLLGHSEASALKLLAIINSEESSEQRLHLFKEERMKILEKSGFRPNQEVQTESEWSFWGALWTFIVSIFCFCWPSSDDEQLIAILSINIQVKRIKGLQLTKNSSATGKQTDLLPDSDYEKALFTNPELALADINWRVNFLPQGSESIDNIRERLEAIKRCLNPAAYLGLLAQLYAKHPIDTISYYYQRYVNDFPNPLIFPEDFIENELLSSALLNLFISPMVSDPINPRCFAILDLLLVLAFPQESAFENLLQVAQSRETSPTTNESSSCYQRLQPKILKFWSLPELQPDSFTSKKQPQTSSSIIKQKGFDLDNPLLINFARLACQDLLIHYHNHPNQQHNSVLLTTVEILSDKILRTWGAAQKARKEDLMETVFSLEECESILSIFNNTSALAEFDFRNAVYYGNKIILASISGDLTMLNTIKATAPLQPHEAAWISIMTKRLIPHGYIAKEIDYWLNKKIVNSVELKEIGLQKFPKTNQPILKTSDNPQRFSANSKSLTENPEANHEHHLNTASPNRCLL
ncbi:MAG: hypothetical protein H0U70_08555 [Tatlockia sp.]|nr:hypothetical protein [Tatlockia sp.]